MEPFSLIFFMMILFIIFAFSTETINSPRNDTCRQAVVQIGPPPVMLTPSNVRVLNSSQERQIVYSPATSYQTSEQNLPINARFSPPTFEHVFSKNRSQFKSESEMICCEVFEEIVKDNVQVNIRPKFLKNPKTKRNLELDCYYEKKIGDKLVRIGLDYQGSYHYIFVNKFHKNGLESLKEVKERDKLKKELCAKEGVILIIVPYIVDCADKDANGKWKYVAKSKTIRKELLRKFLEPIIYDIFQV